MAKITPSILASQTWSECHILLKFTKRKFLGCCARMYCFLFVQVELVLTFEELLPTKLRRRFVTGRKEIYLNKKPSIRKHLQHFLWAGEPYDTKSSINTALHSQCWIKHSNGIECRDFSVAPVVMK